MSDPDKILLPCPNTLCKLTVEDLTFDWKDQFFSRAVRVACPCGTSGPWYERRRPVVAARVAANAWNKLPRHSGKSGCLLPAADESELASDLTLYGTAYKYACPCGLFHRMVPDRVTLEFKR
jgi:hypothetical protein